MSSLSDDGSGSLNLHSTRSFTRMDTFDTQSPTSNKQATAELLDQSLPTADDGGQGNSPDLFERRGSADSAGTGDLQRNEGFVLSQSVDDPSEELPIELISLSDRFVNSLSAKVHSSPPTIEKVSSLFQVFYSRAESHIATHISTLASRINRDPSPQAPSKSPGNPLSKLSGKISHDDVRSTSARQMLTVEEVSEKRRARKALEYKRGALEEAAERRICETVYDKIWRHSSTLDDVRDEKLRSKTAALLLVGINLKDLGIELDMTTIDEKKQQEANDCIAQAREHLEKMNDYKYPLGKLQQLAAAHKAIVDALTKLLPSSSSADEILPTLIYSLITCPPEGIHIISNFLFIQRFRSSTKIDGETAYCLTNLEAAICFLENVELSSLRADELQEGPPKTASASATPSSERPDPFRPAKETTTSSVTTVSASPELLKPEIKPTSATLPRPQPSPQQRRLSNLFQPPTKVLEAANDAVRSTADQGLKNIGASLDNSFNFLFGRLKELQTQAPNSQGNGSVLPKTLAEARRLVAMPPANQPSLSPEDLASINATHSEGGTPIRNSRATSLASEGHTPRDRSIDSARLRAKASVHSLREEAVSTPSSVTTPNPIESMRYFGNTLNPLNHIPGMIKNFGRQVPETPGTRSLSPAPLDRRKTSPPSMEAPTITRSPVPPPQIIDPPIQRFLQMKDARDLRIGDVASLLDDYKRLAAALSKIGAGSR
ncbi:hypothetical protein N7495_000278 [Penicillium taxi]|uniref:uncharacterized protein n=1 Tax=Penicillium taxi TaxID=168475 RepID=UPI002545226E|nr:uncharacterized protein N7495_000278 [Penicillium taxi]KAJ5907596.1 hypothetical protein N7495_000278 [Penicillium taxi]